MNDERRKKEAGEGEGRKKLAQREEEQKNEEKG